jgi:dihydroneopterin aldolase
VRANAQQVTATMPSKKKQPLGVIRLYNAVFYAYHGVLSDEQSLGGKFEVDVELRCDLSKGAKSDHLKDTVNYERVYDSIRSSVTGRKYFLLEALAKAISQEILKNFRQVVEVTVKVRKPGAPVRGVIDTVEVQLTDVR